MEILKGLPVANSINEQLIEDIKNIDGELPHLAIIRVGDRVDMTADVVTAQGESLPQMSFFVNVLEIEPIGVYGYNNDGGKDIIKTWYGLPKTSSVTVNVTSMSINAFAGLNEDILSKYDLVIIGDRGSAQTVGKVFGSHMYNTDRTSSLHNTSKGLSKDDAILSLNILFDFVEWIVYSILVIILQS